MTWDPNKTRLANLDEDEKAILEMIKGRINYVHKHRLDMDLLIDKVEQIICEIEDIALEADDGYYELPPQERED